MRRILMALIVAAIALAGCGGDDDAGGGFGSAADLGEEILDGDAEGLGGGSGDGGDDGSQISADPDGDLADFPIPSPDGALDAIVAEIDGVLAAQIWYDVDRFNELADTYETWFLDNGLIANPVDRTVGQISLGGQNDTGSYLATVVTTNDQVFVQLTVEE